ncbi:MAG TPA: hypothetical protein VFR02_03640 [bacterium]|nr:hypothetical protein [bacterium]
MGTEHEKNADDQKIMRLVRQVRTFVQIAKQTVAEDGKWPTIDLTPEALLDLDEVLTELTVRAGLDTAAAAQDTPQDQARICTGCYKGKMARVGALDGVILHQCPKCHMVVLMKGA